MSVDGQGPGLKDMAHFISNIVRMALIVSPEDAAKVLEAVDHENAMMPYLDPTAYMREQGDASKVSMLTMRAFLAFRRELAKVEALPEFRRVKNRVTPG